ncbi:RHS repeat-associated core domain-containing protein [Paludibaculum fermentans]|uniref:RHS repeat-associated core domain-containing protein n=1 Tax=Paludibaculum fermentans TaxID=1473598 RepID=A0A7S7NNC3_PALFE|nr:RHS repeat-associated core domain-containing protein [Paludibaculum fermentans]QOY86792.1 RHS repeat-associated core domain-containing protein [Paludibaculum fermentans]
MPRRIEGRRRGPEEVLTRNYTHDVPARISTANEGTGSWKRAYGYDSAGNRYVDPDTSKTSGYAISPFTPTTSSNFDARNRLGVNNSTYDPSGNGNQTAIGSYTYSYDAENRMITAKLGGGGTEVSSTGYVYDGEGQRVQKITCPAGTQTCTASVAGATSTTYVYDAFGNLAAEYSGAGSAPVGCGTPTCYVSVDQIGSTRLVTDANGNAVRRYDYTPYGEELWAGTGGRTTAMGYQSGPDGFNPKFTGQQRDTENFLDYFHARYYSPQQGRFVSVDPENAGADPASPQTWNGYAYVSNNPLSYTDPTGEGIFGFLGSIIGGFFGGPLGAWIGSLAGNGADAAIWGPEAGGASFYNPTNNFGLGNASPWGSTPGLGGAGGDVYGGGSTGGMIFSYEGPVHHQLTYFGAMMAGLDPLTALRLSYGVMAVDWRGGLKTSQGTDPTHAHWHAMAGVTEGGHEGCGQAHGGTIDALGGATQRALGGDQAATTLALHMIQDSYASGHQYKFWPGGAPSVSHIAGDLAPSPTALNMTAQYLFDLKAGKMRSAYYYLAKPQACGPVW